MTLTDRQKARQVARIYGLIFDELDEKDKEETAEGLVKVEINEKVKEIFLNNLPLGEEIDINALENCIRNIVTEIVEYVCSENSTLNLEYAVNVITFIVSDLVNSNLRYVEIDSGNGKQFDPMFG